MYDNAIEAFNKALQSEDIELQKKAYYNRGNSHYQKGAEMRQADPQAAADQWRQALASLQSALELDPADEDARHNQEIVTKQLAQLEEDTETAEAASRQATSRKTAASRKTGRRNGSRANAALAERGRFGEGQIRSVDPTAGRQAERTTRRRRPKTRRRPRTRQRQVAAADQTDRQQATPAEQAVRDAERRQLGKMTKEEAERMLNALKQEEGELNFVPSGRTMDKTDRDW